MKIQETNTGYELPEDRKAAIRKKKLKRKRKRLKSFLLLILFIATFISLALSPVCNIQKIEVNGSKHYKNEEIIPLTGINLGDNGFKTIGKNLKNIFTLRYGKAESNIIKNHPYIRTVEVKFVLPNKIRVNITERNPFVLVPFTGLDLLVDKEGYVVDTKESSGKSSLPVIIGLKFPRYGEGQALKFDHPEAFEAVCKVMDAIHASDAKGEFQISPLLHSVDVSDMSNISILLDSRITVNLGTLEKLDYRLQFLKEIYKKGLKKEEKGTLDFTTGDKPNFMPQ